jgi:hypothetical protein
VNTISQTNEQIYHSFYKNRPFKNENVVFDISKEKYIKQMTDKKGKIILSNEETQEYIVNLARQKKNKGIHNDRKHLFEYTWLTFLFHNEEKITQLTE